MLTPALRVVGFILSSNIYFIVDRHASDAGVCKYEISQFSYFQKNNNDLLIGHAIFYESSYELLIQYYCLLQVTGVYITPN